MNFSFTVRKPKDKTWGSLQKDNTWNGMVGDLVNNVTDLGTEVTEVFSSLQAANKS